MAWFLIISTPFIPILLLDSLENRFEPVNTSTLEQPGAEYDIVVLGGGHGFDDRLPPNSLLSLNALSRLNEGIRLHRELANSRLVLSGYSSSGRTTQAEMLQKTAILLGVDEERTIIQTEPANTWQEANVYSERFGDSYPVILVTSAVHMPRAMLVFERNGISAIASPANYRLKGSHRKKRLGLPSTGNIAYMRSALNEYAALIREKIMR